MVFRDLCMSCKNWDDSTQLHVVFGDDLRGQTLPLRVAKCLYGDYFVLWFKDCVVRLR